MTEITDEILLDRLKKGDVHSLGVLYERYKTLFFNFFLRITGDYDASNDLLMETFDRIYKYSSSYKPIKKARPWIYQIASNLTKDYFKKSKRTKALEEMNLEILDDNHEFLDDGEYRNRQLMSAMGQLNARERSIINMYYLLEMSYEEISGNENISVNNARILVCRALKKLKKLLKNSGI
ncbi:RNA polymerase sigma factor [uncultured Eudoraea sp.]|uniref:RNA polymerase sigma factor n=1 Tax=uncultured Eudoraea sp. TaxID=1035614 RepID=UPI00260D6A50|nr:RNA polymerase sigma factor [uncultured Eudoraea sp.]